MLKLTINITSSQALREVVAQHRRNVPNLSPEAWDVVFNYLDEHYVSIDDVDFNNFREYSLKEYAIEFGVIPTKVWLQAQTLDIDLDDELATYRDYFSKEIFWDDDEDNPVPSYTSWYGSRWSIHLLLRETCLVIFEGQL